MRSKRKSVSAREAEARSASEESIRAVAEIERASHREKTAGERATSALVGVIERPWFVLFNLGFFLAWCLMNRGLVPGLKPFDPYPYGLLTLLLSVEAVSLALLILINQSLLLKQSELRSHLNLQIALLAERESTRILRVVNLIARDQGVPTEDPDDRHLTRDTKIEELADELKRSIDSSSPSRPSRKE